MAKPDVKPFKLKRIYKKYNLIISISERMSKNITTLARQRDNADIRPTSLASEAGSRSIIANETPINLSMSGERERERERA